MGNTTFYMSKLDIEDCLNHLVMHSNFHTANPDRFKRTIITY